MPTLPGITINNQAVFDRVVAAFGTVENYKTWQKQQLKRAVIEYEIGLLQQQAKATIEQRRSEIDAEIDTVA